MYGILPLKVTMEFLTVVMFITFLHTKTVLYKISMPDVQYVISLVH
jgi:hypothetical protein